MMRVAGKTVENMILHPVLSLLTLLQFLGLNWAGCFPGVGNVPNGCGSAVQLGRLALQSLRRE